MTYRKLSRAITVVALGAAALMAFPAAASAQPGTGVIYEEGYVVECSGAGDGYTASVTLYENSRFGDEASVVIETADGTLLGVTNDGPFLTDGTIDDVVVSLAPEGNPDEPVGSATVSGSYIISGEPTRVHQVENEGEAIVISVGTNTPLTVDLTLEYAGTTIALECDTAFAFDLQRIERRIGTPG
jgi:hypothetical protein